MTSWLPRDPPGSSALRVCSKQLPGNHPNAPPVECQASFSLSGHEGTTVHPKVHPLCSAIRWTAELPFPFRDIQGFFLVLKPAPWTGHQGHSKHHVRAESPLPGSDVLWWAQQKQGRGPPLHLSSAPHAPKLFSNTPGSVKP